MFFRDSLAFLANALSSVPIFDKADQFFVTSPESILFFSRDSLHEAHLSAECPAPQEASWLPAPYADAGRSRHPQAAAPQGPPQAFRIGSASGAAPYAPLRKSSDVGRVRRVGSRRRVGGITVFAAPGEPGPPRVAFVAGRAVGDAVRRNRAKRRLREALRRVPLGEGRDYVVIASPAAIAAPFEALVAWARAAMMEEE